MCRLFEIFDYKTRYLTMLWIKSLHIISMVTWFAGLFYLPRLFVYHAMCTDQAGIDRFKVMERKLYYGIMTPGGLLTIILVHGCGWATVFPGWLHTKLALVVLLVAYHLYCGKLLIDFRNDRNRHGHVYYRWFNELPVLALFAIIILVVVKPY